MAKYDYKISTSMMCADFTNMSEYLQLFEEEGIDLLHIDVMDGIFAPNFCLGTVDVAAIRQTSKIPLDFHFMVNDPEAKLHWFNIQKGDRVAFHIESTKDTDLAIDEIHRYQAKAFVALEQDSQIEQILPALDHGADGILAMSVNVGFAGQKIQSHAFDKIVRLKQFLIDNNYDDIEIEVDGNMSPTNAQKMYNCGAKSFVAGTSSIFKAQTGEKFDKEYIRSLIRSFREQIVAPIN